MRLAFFALALGSAVGAVLATSADARACGGDFGPPSTQTNVDLVSGHRMIFRVTPQATTLYDEISYMGSPQSFAWVLPIQGPVTVGLSSDIVFAALDSLTQTTLVSPPPPFCGDCSCDCGGTGSSSGSSSSGGGFGGGGGADAGGVSIIGQQTVGPYQTVQLQSTDPNALTNWLTSNGYTINTDVQPVIAAYVKEGFDFLALKLAPNQGVSAMRPVRVTTPGAGLSLPLRMVAAGTGANVTVTLWVLGDGRYDTQSFPSFVISPSDVTWNWYDEFGGPGGNDYATVQAAREASFNHAAWQIESAMTMVPFEIEMPILADPASQDYLPISPSDAGGDAGGVSETADQVRQDDLAMLFPTTTDVWVTRMRGDLARAALANDLVLQAAASQSEISNIYQVTNQVNVPACQPCAPCQCPAPGDDGDDSGLGGGASSGSSGGGNGAGAGAVGFGSGCSTVGDDGNANTDLLVLAGLGLAVVVHRGRRRGRA